MAEPKYDKPQNSGSCLYDYSKRVSGDAKGFLDNTRRACDISTGSNIDGYKGTAVNSGLKGNFLLNAGTIPDRILSSNNIGSSSGTDTVTKIAGWIGVGTAVMTMAAGVISLFPSKTKDDNTLANQLDNRQLKAIQEQERETDAIKSDLTTTITSADTFLNSGNNDSTKAATLSTTLQNYVSSAQARKNILSNKETELETQISNKQNEYDKLNSDKSGWTKEKAGYEEDLQTLKNTDTSNMTPEQKKLHDDKITELEGKIKELEKKIEDADKKLPKMQEEINKLKLEKAQYAKQANELDEEIRKAESRITKLNKIANPSED